MYEYTSLPVRWTRVNEEIKNFASEDWELVCVTPLLVSTPDEQIALFFKRVKA